MTREEWLKSLKVGDEVLMKVGTYFFNSRERIEKVERFTNKFVCVGGYKFYKKDGYGYGCNGEIDIAKDSDRERIERSKKFAYCRGTIDSTFLKHCSDDELDTLYNLKKKVMDRNS